LLHVAHALRPPARLTGTLHGREQEADERGNDRDHDQEFDEREALR
jgi:hypothetical protein